MSKHDQVTLRNKLLRAMSQQDFALLAPHLTACRLNRNEILYDTGSAIKYAWFPESGVGSLVSTSEHNQQVETGVFGVDGFTPVSILLDYGPAPYRGLIQVGGEGWRVDAGALRTVIDESPTLRTFLLRYVQALYVQTTYTSLSNAVHQIDERLARWLLMCHDRAGGNEIHLTHEVLSVMLAVRRPSITSALHVLEGNGFIRSDRGCIQIRDRPGLEAFAGNSYGPSEREYDRLIPPSS